MNKRFFLFCFSFVVLICSLSFLVCAAEIIPCPDCGEILTQSETVTWNCGSMIHNHERVTTTHLTCSVCGYHSTTASYGAGQYNLSTSVISHYHTASEAYNEVQYTSTCVHCGAVVDQYEEDVICESYSRLVGSTWCVDDVHPHMKRSTYCKACSSCGIAIGDSWYTWSPAEYNTVRGSSQHIHAGSVTCNEIEVLTVCKHCGLEVDSYTDTENVETYTYESSVYLNSSTNQYEYVSDVYCSYDNELLSHTIVPVQSGFVTCWYVGDSEWGERASGSVTYHVGGTADTLTVNNHNIISHARMSGRFNGYDYLVLLKDIVTGEYYVFGTDTLPTGLYGTQVSVGYLSNSLTYSSLTPVGVRKTVYAFQLYYDGTRMYYNGVELPLSSLIFTSGHQLYKREFQYLTSGSYLGSLTESYWLSHEDFSTIKFCDYDNDGKFEYCFYDTTLTLNLDSLSANQPHFNSRGDESVLISTASTNWLRNNYLPVSFLDSSISVGTKCLVKVRVRESSTSASCIENAEIELSNCPYVQLPYRLVSSTFDPTQHNSDYVPNPSEFVFEGVYTNGETRRLLSSALTVENIENGARIRVKFFGRNYGYYYITVDSWYVPQQSGNNVDDSGSYMDGYLAGLVDSNPVMGFIEGVWFALRDAALLVLNGISVGGIKLSSILVSLLIIFLVGFVVKSFLK